MHIRIVGLLFMSSIMAGCSHPPEREPHILWMDDTGHENDGSEFESAFAVDRTCEGLRFYRMSGTTAGETSHVLAPRWNVQYFHRELNGQGIYVLWMTAEGFLGLKVSETTKSAAEAVRKACIVAKEKGGSR